MTPINPLSPSGIYAPCASMGLALIAMGIGFLPQSLWAMSEVWASYSAGSEILDINVSQPIGPHPANVAVPGVSITPGPGANGSGHAEGAYDVQHSSIRLKCSMWASANSSATNGIDRIHGAGFQGGFVDSIMITTVPPQPIGTPLHIAPVISIHSLFSHSASGVLPYPDGDASFASPSYDVTILMDPGYEYGPYEERQKFRSCFESAAFPPDPCVDDLSETWVVPAITVYYGVPVALTMHG